MSQLDHRVRFRDHNREQIIVHRGDQHVIVDRLFPTCYLTEEQREENWRHFHVRFYLPNEVVTNHQASCERLFIMTNGLDELRYTTLYDELGTRLASQGAAAVLLPLPDHLNRHMRYRIPDALPEQLALHPSDILMASPENLFIRYLQFKEEVDVLRQHVGNNSPCSLDGECRFYRALFSETTRISLLGYSLGGAAMLGTFLEQLRSNGSFNLCVLLSAAINLRHVNSEPIIPESEWEDYVDRLERSYAEQRKDLGSKELPLHELFGSICFGLATLESRELLRKHGNRVLFLYGGRDRLVDYDLLQEIKPKGWGLSMLILPGIDHFIGHDEEWKKWIQFVVNLLIEYEANAARKTLTDSEAVRLLLEPRILDDRQRTQLQVRSELLGYEIQQKAPSGEQAINKADRRTLLNKVILKRHPEHTDTSTSKEAVRINQRQLRLCEFLCSLNVISKSEAREALLRQEQLSAKCQHKRIGEILADSMRLLTTAQVEEVCSLQSALWLPNETSPK